MGLLQLAKDWLVESAARPLLNKSILLPYGTMTTLKLDSQNKSMSLDLELKGEPAPIHIEIPRYTLVEQDGKTYLEMPQILTSREWMNVLLQQHFAPVRLAVPPAVKTLM